MYRKVTLIFALAVLLLFVVPTLTRDPARGPYARASSQELNALTRFVYLPLVLNSSPGPVPTPTPSPTPFPAPGLRRVNAPNFQNSQIDYAATSVFWFGKIDPLTVYTDVRVGYNAQKLLISLNVVDRRLWYNPDPTPDTFSLWDASSLYLNLDGNNGTTPGARAYRFDGQLSWWESRSNFQSAYQGNGSAWSAIAVPFTTTSSWRGNAPNDDTDDRGWRIDFEIPFASLGLTGPPPEGTQWGLGLALHNRDYAEYPPRPDESWPPTLSPNMPSTWGQLAFGLPAYSAPTTTSRVSVTIRQGLNGAIVPDAAVGGTMDNLCGASHGSWSEWGTTSFLGAPRFNVQNQADIADWACFSKYYVVFPLDAVPPGKAIISATLTLHEFGNSGQPDLAIPSLIQVMTTNEDWNGQAITWNTAPLASENVSRTWVNPITVFPGWPGVPWKWDLGGAVAGAYASGKPLRLVLYEADSAYHSGKYFIGSNEPDWNASARPQLDVVWGDP